MAKNKTKQVRVLACGSREYTDQDTINRVLDALHVKYGPRMCLITGGAVGADELARKWATSRKCDHIVYYAKWDTEGKSAGPLRNERMADLKPKRVVAFMVQGDDTKNRGTRDMINKAMDRGITVKRFF